MSDEEMEYSDDDFDAYYEEEFDRDVDHVDPQKNDPEYFHVVCLTDTEVERLLNESVEQLSNSIQVGGCGESYGVEKCIKFAGFIWFRIYSGVYVGLVYFLEV